MADIRNQQLMKTLFGDESDEEVMCIEQSSQGLSISEKENNGENAKLEVESKSATHETNKGKRKIIEPELESRKEDIMCDNKQERFHRGIKSTKKPVGPPLQIEAPFRPSISQTDKMAVMKVSNSYAIEKKPFDPKTYEENDGLACSRPNNIVRWREVENPDGSKRRESNARFVRWSDGSTQLQIGNEYFDVKMQQIPAEQRLMLNHGKGVLQSQGRLLNKMMITPSSFFSDSPQTLSSHAAERRKKVPKIKLCDTYHPDWEVADQATKAEEKGRRDKVMQNCDESEKTLRVSSSVMASLSNKDDVPEPDHQRFNSLISPKEDLQEQLKQVTEGSGGRAIGKKIVLDDESSPRKLTTHRLHKRKYVYEGDEL